MRSHLEYHVTDECLLTLPLCAPNNFVLFKNEKKKMDTMILETHSHTQIWSEFVTTFRMVYFVNAGGPLAVTRPHMLDTAMAYRTVVGLQPDYEKHKIYADLEPVRSMI